MNALGLLAEVFLMASNGLRSMTEETKKILENTAVNAIDLDSKGMPVKRMP